MEYCCEVGLDAVPQIHKCCCEIREVSSIGNFTLTIEAFISGYEESSQRLHGYSMMATEEHNLSMVHAREKSLASV